MILITGCSGFIGKNLLAALSKKGEDLTCYDFLRPSWFPADIVFFKGNLLDENSLKNALSGVDFVFHCLDIKRPGVRGRRYMRKVNVKGTATLLEAAKKTGVKRFFFISSCSVYGKKSRLSMLLYKRPWKPLTAYGKDKLRAEAVCQKYAQEGLEVTIFRPGAIISPGTKNPAALACLFMAFGMNERGRLHLYSLSARYQFLDIHDAVEAILVVYASGLSAGKTYDIGSDDVPERAEEIAALSEKAGLNCEIKKLSAAKLFFYRFLFKFLGSNLFTGEHFRYLTGGHVMDCSEIKKDFGWKPSVGNIEILIEVCHWYKKEKLKQAAFL